MTSCVIHIATFFSIGHFAECLGLKTHSWENLFPWNFVLIMDGVRDTYVCITSMFCSFIFIPFHLFLICMMNCGSENDKLGKKKKSHSFHHTETSSFKKNWVLEKKLNCSTFRSLKQNYCCLEKELNKHQVVESTREFQGGGMNMRRWMNFFFLWFKKRKKREHTNQRTTFYKENFALPCTNGNR